MSIFKNVIPALILGTCISASAASPASALKDLTFDRLMYFVAGVVESTPEYGYAECLPENTSLVDLALVVQRALVKYPMYLDKPSSVFVRASLADMYCPKDVQPQKPPEKTL